jgi:hypothetical protein
LAKRLFVSRFAVHGNECTGVRTSRQTLFSLGPAPGLTSPGRGR